MNAIITRHFSGFVNVADKFILGNHEHEGRARCDKYTLPVGYAVDGHIIRDALGYECAIVPQDDGADLPMLISLAGPLPNVVIAEAK